MSPLQCHKCGRFIGPDGYPDVMWDDYHGAYEEGYTVCGPCGRAEGRDWPQSPVRLDWPGGDARGSSDDFTREIMADVAVPREPERCPCGKRPTVEREDRGYVVECVRCGFGGWGETEAMAISRYNWKLARGLAKATIQESKTVEVKK